jgi:hypothetical protein
MHGQAGRAWEFAIRSVRTWQGNRPGSPCYKRYTRSYRVWLRDQLRRRKLAESTRFTRQVRRLIEAARRERVRQDKIWTWQVRRILEACVPDKVGDRYHDERTGYKCRPGGDSAVAAPAVDGGKDKGNSDRRRAKGQASGSRSRKARDEKKYTWPKKSPQALRHNAARLINDGPKRTLQERCELIAKLVKEGSASRNRDALSPAVAEGVGAVMLDCELRSQGEHGFDLRGRSGGKCVIIDVKHSRSKAGYDDRYGGKKGGKAHKIQESIDNPDCVPAYLVFAEGHGIYLHPGIDPKQTAEFATRKGNASGRGLATPQGVADAINTGAADQVPFVLLSDKYKSLRDSASITPADLVSINRRMAATIKGINMDKLKEHLAKQRQAADDDGRQMLAKRDAAATARAAAKEDAVATARAAAKEDPAATIREGMKAKGFSDEQIEAVLAMKPRK